ncbi:GNAT family N-acetyltransferase [Falsibacillus albus]|uniref:N-acetyltransferase n=1 Tax=Falsibacillus albus TaxID=2478915 RepID=A0A3L7K3Q6_9BACI|nr:GNAT family protein [Falsibacillus albus]RLQ97460.1 N-acetyltransferase [Falsibacillus albus]
MDHLKVKIDSNLKDFFNILNGLPDYIAIEEMTGCDPCIDQIKTGLMNLIDTGMKLNLKRISAAIQQTSVHYLELAQILKDLGFQPHASKVVVYRDLKKVQSNKDYKWESLSKGVLTEGDFKKFWERCMSGSANAPSTLTMDEHLQSVKSELGEAWEDACNLISLNGCPIGISIPHIEPGTADEGRLFYFGILPEERGKGHSSPIHYQSLNKLKQIGASYYIGSTHESNIKMQKVFLRNGCEIKGKIESFYYYFPK